MKSLGKKENRSHIDKLEVIMALKNQIPVHLGILESAHLPFRLSVMKNSLVSNSERCPKVFNVKFSTPQEFESGLCKGMQELHKINPVSTSLEPPPRIFTISSHGVPGTGTRLECETDIDVDLHLVATDYFPYPNNMVMFFSVCFGAFPSILSFYRKLPGPIAIGPLVEIDSVDANQMLAEIIGKASETGIHDLKWLSQKIDRVNERLSKYYAGRNVWRIITPDGNPKPPMDGTQGAFPTAGPTTLKIIKLEERYPEDVIGDGPNIVILKDKDENSYESYTGMLYQQLEIDDLSIIVGKELKGCIYQYWQSNGIDRISLLPGFRLDT
jgi:hypothetical protein